MKYKRLLTLSSLFLLSACNVTPNNDTSLKLLHADGYLIKDSDNNVINLRGTNIGGWLHLEGWMDGGGYLNNGKVANHQAVLDSFKQRNFSFEQQQKLLDTYQNSYFTLDDLKEIKSLGLNFIRVPFYWTEILDDDGNLHDYSFKQLDWVIREAGKLGIYVVLDLHGTPGGHSGGWDTGGYSGSNEFWTSQKSQDYAKKIWEEISKRYKDNNTVLGYDLLNEPVPPEGKEFEGATKKAYDMLYKAVREIDQNHIIIMEAFFNFDTLGSPADNNWENVIYQTHHYNLPDKQDEYRARPQVERDYIQASFAISQIQYVDTYRKQWNVPAYLGEFSLFDSPHAWNTFIASMNYEGMMWSNWTYKNTHPQSWYNWGYYYTPELTYIDYEIDTYDEMLEKWSNFGSEHYQKNEMLRNVVTKNNELSYESSISRKDFKVNAYQTNGEFVPLNILDDDWSSYWQNTEPQSSSKNQYVSIDFGKEISLKEIHVISNHFGDYAKGLKIQYLKNNMWYDFDSNSETNIGINIFKSAPITTTRIKINQTNDAASWWAINEIYFF